MDNPNLDSNEPGEDDSLQKLGIEILEINENETISNKIKMSPETVGMLDSVLQGVPMIFQGKEIFSDSYKVVFDKGLGELQRAANMPGWYRGNVVKAGTNNVITGGALLQKMSNMPQIVSSVFSAMSIVTGQYYMHQVNAQLKAIDEKLQDIYSFLENDK